MNNTDQPFTPLSMAQTLESLVESAVKTLPSSESEEIKKHVIGASMNSVICFLQGAQPVSDILWDNKVSEEQRSELAAWLSSSAEETKELALLADSLIRGV